MSPTPIRTVRVTERGKDQLIKLKRFTGIKQWNVLCRWALCSSLAEKAPPSPTPIGDLSNVEMSWPVFAGSLGDVFLVLLRQRCHEDGLPTDDASVAEQFRLHLHRGIGYLAATNRVRQIEDLVQGIPRTDSPGRHS